MQYSAAWDDPDYDSHNQKGPVCYFHFNVFQETYVVISLESAADAQLFVLYGTPPNG